MESLTDRVEAHLREEIIVGNLAPFAPLRMAQLSQRFETGATPVREALSRLLPEGLVELTTNRGFRVSGVSRDDLLDIIVARTTVEVQALRLAIEKGDEHWEARIVGAHYRYKRHMEANDGHPQQLEIEPPHDDLHAALISSCGSPRLIEMSARLAQQHGRYQRIFSQFVDQRYHSKNNTGRRTTKFELARPFRHGKIHEELIEVVLSRDAERAAELLSRHLMFIVNAFDEIGFWDAQNCPTAR